MIFYDRTDAGQKLAKKLSAYAGRDDLLVLALPRGGVPVAFEVARELNAPLDVFLVRKLGVPGQEELAMGAIATGGTRVLNESLVHYLNIPRTAINEVAAVEQRELERREKAYRNESPPLEVREKTVILIDDGLATGATMRAAATALRQLHPKEIVVAVPVASDQACSEFGSEVDRLICAVTPEPFHGVGKWYQDFAQTSDEEVQELLRLAADFGKKSK